MRIKLLGSIRRIRSGVESCAEGVGGSSSNEIHPEFRGGGIIRDAPPLAKG